MVTCRPGTHHVKSHMRISVEGRRHIVKAHCRTNPRSRKNVLYASNVNYLFKKNKNRFKELKKIKRYNDHGQYDKLIQFWLDYWDRKKIIDFKIDPILIKAIIAVESSFREGVITKEINSSATGLMQITKTTMGHLAGIRNAKGEIEVRTHQVSISQEEARIAPANIAAGIRWLLHKIKTSPRRNSKNIKDRLHGGVKFYYGWTDDGQRSMEKVLRIYEENK